MEKDPLFEPEKVRRMKQVITKEANISLLCMGGVFTTLMIVRIRLMNTRWYPLIRNRGFIHMLTMWFAVPICIGGLIHNLLPKAEYKNALA